MVRLPDVDPARLQKPKPASRYEESAEWDGPASLGREAVVRDLALRRGWDLVDTDLAEHRFAAWTREEDTRFDDAAAALSPTDANGFAKRAAQGVFERAKLFKESLPPVVRPAFDDRLADYERKHFNKAAAAEDRVQLRAVRDHLDTTLRSTLIPAASAAGALPADDPDKLDRIKSVEASALLLIDRNPALSPHERQLYKATATNAIHTAFAEALSPQEKQDLDANAVIETVGERIRRLVSERRQTGSGTSDDATPEDETSANPDGFGREAWLNLIRNYKPELGDGKTYAEILALRADPDLSAELRERGLADSARFFIGNGYAATPGRLYLANLISRETTLLLLQADPDRLAADVDPVTAPLRPALFFADGDDTKPRTVGAVLALAEEVMAGTRSVDWRQQLSGASPELQAALAADGGEAETRAAADATLAEADAYRRQIEETEQAIDAGTFGEADLVKATGEGGWIKGEDAQRLRDLIKKHTVDMREYGGALSKFLNPDYRFDPNSPEDQRAVDLLYERGHPGDAVGITKSDTAGQLTFQAIVDRTGITPAQAADQTTNVGPGSEYASTPSERIVRETKSDRFIPEYHKTLANLRARITDLGIPDAMAAFGELRHQLSRAGIGNAFGEGAVENYDEFTGWADELFGDIRDEIHGYIDEHGEGLSTLERDNWKSLADAGTALAVAALGSAGGGAKWGRGKHGHGADYNLDRETFQKLGYSIDDGFGNLRHVETRNIGGVEYRVFRVRTKQEPGGISDAEEGTAEFKALNEPEANAIYELDNGTMFRTNEERRVDRREYTIGPKYNRSRAKPEFDETLPKDFEHGHAQGRASGGSSDKSNLFYQHRNFNRGAFVVWEKRTRALNAQRVRVDFIRLHDQRTHKPDELHGSYLVDGKWHETVFKNGPGGK